MTPNPSKRYTADELPPMVEAGWLFVNVMELADAEPRYVVSGHQDDTWIDNRLLRDAG